MTHHLGVAQSGQSARPGPERSQVRILPPRPSRRRSPTWQRQRAQTASSESSNLSVGTHAIVVEQAYTAVREAAPERVWGWLRGTRPTQRGSPASLARRRLPPMALEENP